MAMAKCHSKCHCSRQQAAGGRFTTNGDTETETVSHKQVDRQPSSNSNNNNNNRRTLYASDHWSLKLLLRCPLLRLVWPATKTNCEKCNLCLFELPVHTKSKITLGQNSSLSINWIAFKQLVKKTCKVSLSF